MAGHLVARRQALAGGLGALLLSGCGAVVPLPQKELGSGGSAPVVVGSSPFADSTILAELYAQSIERTGLTVTRKFGIGQREAYVPMVRTGEVHVVPETTGALLNYFEPAVQTRNEQRVIASLTQLLSSDAGLAVLTPAPAEDRHVLVMTKARANEWGVQLIPDLRRLGSRARIAASREFEERQQGLKGLKACYDVTLTRVSTSPDQRLAQLFAGQVDLVVTNSVDPAITTHGLVVLEDPLLLFGANNVVPLVHRPRGLDVGDTLDALSAQLTTDDLKAMMLRASVERVPIDVIAREWLAQHPR